MPTESIDTEWPTYSPTISKEDKPYPGDVAASMSMRTKETDIYKPSELLNHFISSKAAKVGKGSKKTRGKQSVTGSKSGKGAEVPSIVQETDNTYGIDGDDDYSTQPIYGSVYMSMNSVNHVVEMGKMEPSGKSEKKGIASIGASKGGKSSGAIVGYVSTEGQASSKAGKAEQAESFGPSGKSEKQGTATIGVSKASKSSGSTLSQMTNEGEVSPNTGEVHTSVSSAFMNDDGYNVSPIVGEGENAYGVQGDDDYGIQAIYDNANMSMNTVIHGMINQIRVSGKSEKQGVASIEASKGGKSSGHMLGNVSSVEQKSSKAGKAAIVESVGPSGKSEKQGTASTGVSKAGKSSGLTLSHVSNKGRMSSKAGKETASSVSSAFVNDYGYDDVSQMVGEAKNPYGIRGDDDDHTIQPIHGDVDMSMNPVIYEVINEIGVSGKSLKHGVAPIGASKAGKSFGSIANSVGNVGQKISSKTGKANIVESVSSSGKSVKQGIVSFGKGGKSSGTLVSPVGSVGHASSKSGKTSTIPSVESSGQSEKFGVTSFGASKGGKSSVLSVIPVGSVGLTSSKSGKTTTTVDFFVDQHDDYTKPIGGHHLMSYVMVSKPQSNVLNQFIFSKSGKASTVAVASKAQKVGTNISAASVPEATKDKVSGNIDSVTVGSSSGYAFSDDYYEGNNYSNVDGGDDDDHYTNSNGHIVSINSPALSKTSKVGVAKAFKATTTNFPESVPVENKSTRPVGSKAIKTSATVSDKNEIEMISKSSKALKSGSIVSAVGEESHSIGDATMDDELVLTGYNNRPGNYEIAQERYNVTGDAYDYHDETPLTDDDYEKMPSTPDSSSTHDVADSRDHDTTDSFFVPPSDLRRRRVQSDKMRAIRGSTDYLSL